MIRFVRVGLASLVVSTAVAAVGCGGGTQPAAPAERKENAQQIALAEVAHLIEASQGEGGGGKPAAKLEELAKARKVAPIGYDRLRSGDVLLYYGVAVGPNASDVVLAYDKAAPESGGLVLMQDGKTIRSMTADEFMSAKKAGTEPPKPPAPAPGKKKA